MFRSRTHDRTFPRRFTRRLAGPTMALAAVAASTVAASTAASRPVTASIATTRPVTTRPVTVRMVAFTRLLQPSAAIAARRVTPQQIAWSLLKSHGWWTGEYTYLSRLWIRESGWNPHASNPYSGAYGIPQAVPGSKMASVGPDWRTSPRTQILWGMRYIKVRYGTPYRAWRHELSYGWY
jgi:hypothetical protein